MQSRRSTKSTKNPKEKRYKKIRVKEKENHQSKWAKGRLIALKVHKD
jgi:hypothetical protein